MANILFKKSYLLKNFNRVEYDDLWNKNGIFTTIRVIGKPYRFVLFDQHLKNLYFSLRQLRIKINFNKRKILRIINSQFDKKKDYDHLLRIAIDSRLLSLSLRKRLKPQKKFFASIKIYQRPNYKYKNLKYKKILNYISSISTSRHEILLVKKKCLLEGCTTNLLLIKKKKIYIPQDGYYFGVTLKYLIKKFKKFIIKKNIYVDKLDDFEEILLVGSGKGVVSVNKIKDLNWRGKKNIFYKKLLKYYNRSFKHASKKVQ